MYVTFITVTGILLTFRREKKEKDNDRDVSKHYST